MLSIVVHTHPTNITEQYVDREFSALFVVEGVKTGPFMSISVTDANHSGQQLPAPSICVAFDDHIVWEGYLSDFKKLFEEK